MDDSLLLKLALITSIIGVFSLFIILQSTNIELSSFSQLEDSLEDVVLVKGEVVSVHERSGVSTIIISIEEEMKLVVFDSVDIKEGLTILAKGKLDLYAGKKELLVEEIKIQ